MTSRTLIVAACFAFLTGCQATRGSPDARTDRPPPQQQPQQQPPQQPEATRVPEPDGGERDAVVGQAETLPPEPDLEVPDPADVTAESPAELLGVGVTARVEKVDRKRKQVVFAVQDEISEIQLQSGKEIRVPFNDLRLLTGMEQDKVVEVLEAAGELKVRVLGVGDSMRIVEIEIPEEGTQKPVQGED